MKNIRLSFLSDNLRFLGVKVAIYLNRRVLVICIKAAKNIFKSDVFCSNSGYNSVFIYMQFKYKNIL